ncbi:AraC family transcriptional regulator [Paenibacillus sp. PL2-23]|uniref:helix-turn-helix transcriptional regulator n=1 Tax=Paenibacillus sp. PL2-23 TaxID=2100729 RepID=UPI0030F61743
MKKAEETNPIHPFPLLIPRHRKLIDPTPTFNLLEELKELELSPLTDARWKQQLYFQKLIFELSCSSSNSCLQSSGSLAQMVAAYLRTHYKDSLKYEQLAEQFNFHPHHIVRCFKNQFGCTPQEYLLVYRIKQAKLLLKNSNEDIQAISHHTGFGSSSYFSKKFREIERMAPMAYRNQFFGRNN